LLACHFFYAAITPFLNGETKMAKVISITSEIPGWFLVFSEAYGSKSKYPVVLWALIKDEDRPAFAGQALIRARQA
jgi:hypothetical protein